MSNSNKDDGARLLAILINLRNVVGAANWHPVATPPRDTSATVLPTLALCTNTSVTGPKLTAPPEPSIPARSPHHRKPCWIAQSSSGSCVRSQTTGDLSRCLGTSCESGHRTFKLRLGPPEPGYASIPPCRHPVNRPVAQPATRTFRPKPTT